MNQSSKLGIALVESLDEAALDLLAERLAPRIAERLVGGDDRWLSTKEAANYLGLSVHALHKLTAGSVDPVRAGCTW